MPKVSAILKSEESVHAACPIVSVAVVEGRLVSVVVSNFRPEQPFREELMARERFDRHPRRDLVVVGADRRPVREAMGRVVIPLQPGIERETWIDGVADVARYAPPLLATAC